MAKYSDNFTKYLETVDPSAHIGFNEWNANTSASTATTVENTTTPNTLFGVNTDYTGDLGTAKGYVLQGISDAATPLLQQAKSSLNQRGFGRYSSPTMESTVYAPLINQLANTTRTALTDLWFKDQANTRANTAADEAYMLAEAQNKAINKKSQSSWSVICTELYRQGLLSFSHIKNDLKFLKYHVTEDQHQKYLNWAIPYVSIMKKNKLAVILIYPIVLFWGEYMKRTVQSRPLGIVGRIGLLIHKLGIAFGEVYSMRKEKVNVYN